MNLYSLTLQPSTVITKSIQGNFSSSKTNEIIAAKGKILELLRDVNGQLVSILQQEIFGVINNITTFRYPSDKIDHIVVTSDSGRIVILKYEEKKKQFINLHSETYGKTGIRRIVPSQYVACDPKGRAIMIGAAEKQKFVYILNKDQDQKLTISSPQDTHKSNTITFDMISLDVEFYDMQFATIESEYGDHRDPDSPIIRQNFIKQLVIYEVDISLNNIVKKHAEQIDSTSHMLIGIPGAPQGPGGLLIISEGYLTYKNIKTKQTIKMKYPQRVSLEQTKQMIISNGLFVHKQKNQQVIFLLLQNELGDLFSVIFNQNSKELHSIKIKYFDTIPPSANLNIMKNGNIFCSTQKGNHCFFNICTLGEQDLEICDSLNPEQDVQFLPKDHTNLKLMQQIDNLGSITDTKVEDLTGEGSQQIYTLCAAGSRSTFRILKHGCQANEIASSPLPGNATGI